MGMRQARLPGRFHGILRDHGIRREQGELMVNGLADQHTIERVSMKRRQPRKIEYRLFLQWQCGNPMSFTLRRDKAFGGLRKWKLAKTELDLDFPDGDRAEIGLIGRVSEKIPRFARKRRIIRNQP